MIIERMPAGYFPGWPSSMEGAATFRLLSMEGVGGAGNHGQRTDDGGDDGADGVDDDPPVVVGNLAHSNVSF